MNSNADLAYLDSSAIVKLVRREDETEALQAILPSWPRRVSSQLAIVEVVRAVSRHGNEYTRKARRLLSGLYLIPITSELLSDAGHLDPPTIRTLDAMHLASARLVRAQIVVTYDTRMAVAGREMGFGVVAPGRD